MLFVSNKKLPFRILFLNPDKFLAETLPEQTILPATSRASIGLDTPTPTAPVVVVIRGVGIPAILKSIMAGEFEAPLLEVTSLK